MRMSIRCFRLPVVLAVVSLSCILQGCSKQPEVNESGGKETPKEILNVSYDPTRELYEDFNGAFVNHWKKETGQQVSAKTLHGGSSKQARKVIDGLDADVVTLALAFDIDAIVEKSDGLIAKDWQKRLPNNSAPYTSTIVFLVRKDNPKKIKDWDDLVKEGIEVVTPDPKTSGGARWNYLAAWGYVLKRELGDLSKLNDPKQAEAVAKAQAKAREFVKALVHNVKVFDSGARGATLTFVKNGRGDVLLAWENEAIYSINDMKKGGFEIVVPSVSILAEPSVAVVDKIVDKHGTRKVAEAYLKYLYSPEGQTMAAKHYYRPRDVKSVPEEYMKSFSKVELFTIDDVFGGWRKAQKEHFEDGGIFDQIMKK
jgi:sulfate/thiosulfate transport system substrate-binding protein